jgi:thiamine biosynthesis lipoprotein
MAEADSIGSVGLERPRELRAVRRFSHDAMATVYEVHAVHPDERYAAQAAQAAFDLVDTLERELSRFRPNSDITRINQLAVGESTRVSPSTMECLVIARHMFDVTGGAFDVSIGSGLPSLELDQEGFAVRATANGVRLDLGGIGKGYAVDRMADLLDEWGLTQALVHGGFSSMLALEPPPGLDGWPLTLSDPLAPSKVLVRMSVRQTSIGASGVRKGDHIVDPRTGEPVRGRLAAWVSVPRPGEDSARLRQGYGGSAEALRAKAETADDALRVTAITDALTTAFMLLDADEIEVLCRQSPGLETWLLTQPDGDQSDETRVLHFGGSPD